MEKEDLFGQRAYFRSGPYNRLTIKIDALQDILFVPNFKLKGRRKKRQEELEFFLYEKDPEVWNKVHVYERIRRISTHDILIGEYKYKGEIETPEWSSHNSTRVLDRFSLPIQ